MRACPYCYVEVEPEDVTCPTCEAPLRDEPEDTTPSPYEVMAAHIAEFRR